MRVLNVTDTAAALPNVAPFLPGYSVVALNATAAAASLQSADAIDGDYATIATVPAGGALEVVLDKPFVQLAAEGTLVLLGN